MKSYRCSCDRCPAPGTHLVVLHVPFMDDDRAPDLCDYAAFPFAAPWCVFHANGHTLQSAAPPTVRLQLTLTCLASKRRLPDWIRGHVQVVPMDEHSAAMVDKVQALQEHAAMAEAAGQTRQ